MATPLQSYSLRWQIIEENHPRKILLQSAGMDSLQHAANWQQRGVLKVRQCRRFEPARAIGGRFKELHTLGMPSVTASTAAASLHSTTLMLYRPAAVSALLETVSELAITNTAPSGRTTSEARICNSRGVTTLPISLALSQPYLFHWPVTTLPISLALSQLYPFSWPHHNSTTPAFKCHSAHSSRRATLK